MAKKVEGYIKLQIPAGGATPAPPVGPALGQHGVNIMDFCKQFNAKNSGSARHGDSGRYYGLRGQIVHFHNQDAAGCGIAEKSCGAGQGFGRTEQDQGCHFDDRTG